MIRRALIPALCWLLAWQPAGAVCIVDTAFSPVQYFSTSNTLTFTSTHANELIEIYFEQEVFNGSSAPVILTVTSPNLAWAKRTSYNHATVLGIWSQRQEIWWAIAALPLTSEVVTFTLDKAPPNGNALIFGVILNNLVSSPFDPNASLVAKADDYSGAFGTPQVTGVSTTNGPDIILSYCGQVFRGGGVCTGNATGWTKIQSTTSSDQTSSVIYRAFASPQSGITVPAGGVNVGDWAAMADAIGGPNVCGGGVVPNVWINE